MPNRMDEGNGRNHPMVNDYGMNMNNNFAYTYLRNNSNFQQILPSHSPNLPPESGQYYPSGVGGRAGRIAIGAASATTPSYATAPNNAFMGEMMMRQGMMVGGSDGFRGGQSLGSLSAGLNSMHSNFNGNTRCQRAVRYNNHEDSTNISARPTQQQLFLPQNPNGDLPPVHVYASLSLKDVHSQSISNKGRTSSSPNLRGDTIMFSALAQPSMTWAQLTRHMIEADLDNDSSKWLFPLSVRDEFNSKSHDSDGNNNIYGRFLRYGDGYATYLCPMENERYIHPRPSNYLPLLPLPSVNFEASIFVHLCAPSGPLFHHPPHPEDLVLETLNCYPEYKDMPIVEWRLRLMPLRDAVELAPVLFVNLSMEGDENDGKEGDDKSGKRGELTEAHAKEEMNTENSKKDTMHGNTDKVNALIFTLDERRPGCIGTYCTIPWKTFFSTFAPFAPRRGMDVVDVRAMMSQRAWKEAEIHMDTTRASPASTMQSANTTASTEDPNSKITYSHTNGKKRKMVLPTKNNKHDGGDDELVLDNGISISGADVTENSGTSINTTNSKQGISHQLLQYSGKANENSSLRPPKQHDDKVDVEDNIHNNNSIERGTEKKSGTGKKSHKKMKKDLNLSKRKIGAYSWFMKVNRKLIQEENPADNSLQITGVTHHFKDVEQDEQDNSSLTAEGDKQQREKEKERCSGTPSERKGEEARTDANSDKLAVVWEEGRRKHPKERRDEQIMGHTDIIPGKEATENLNELNEESSKTVADINDEIEKDDVKTGVEGNDEDCKFEDATE